jgi:hypothetical protein
MKFNKVFHYFDIHYSLFEILRFKTKFAWRIEQEEFASTLPGSHAPAWEPIWYAFPRWSMGTRNKKPQCAL